MNSRFHFIFVIFWLTAILITTVYLRSMGNSVSYQLCIKNMEQNQLKQRLWQKQLELENLINPAAMWRHLEQ